jgi:hypothetical protein
VLPPQAEPIQIARMQVAREARMQQERAAHAFARPSCTQNGASEKERMQAAKALGALAPRARTHTRTRASATLRARRTCQRGGEGPNFCRHLEPVDEGALVG